MYNVLNFILVLLRKYLVNLYDSKIEVLGPKNDLRYLPLRISKKNMAKCKSLLFNLLIPIGL